MVNRTNLYPSGMIMGRLWLSQARHNRWSLGRLSSHHVLVCCWDRTCDHAKQIVGNNLKQTEDKER